MVVQINDSSTSSSSVNSGYIKKFQIPRNITPVRKCPRQCPRSCKHTLTKHRCPAKKRKDEEDFVLSIINEIYRYTKHCIRSGLLSDKFIRSMALSIALFTIGLKISSVLVVSNAATT